jgi:hypothetical protein
MTPPSARPRFVAGSAHKEARDEEENLDRDRTVSAPRRNRRGVRVRRVRRSRRSRERALQRSCRDLRAGARDAGPQGNRGALHLRRRGSEGNAQSPDDRRPAPSRRLGPRQRGGLRLRLEPAVRTGAGPLRRRGPVVRQARRGRVRGRVLPRGRRPFQPARGGRRRCGRHSLVAIGHRSRAYRLYRREPGRLGRPAGHCALGAPHSRRSSTRP